MFIKCVCVYRDPFRGENDLLALCETFDDYNCQIPHKTNTRNFLKKRLDELKSEEIWVGIE